MLQIESLKNETKDDWLEEAANTSSGLVITQITEGVRDKTRVNVFINKKFALSLDVKQIVDLGVKVGRQLTEAELQELHKASEFGKLYHSSLEWAFARPHSIYETRTYLKRRQLKRLQLNRKRIQEELKPLPEIQDSAIDLVLERLVERGYVDDKKFAEYYVENRFTKKGVSKRRLVTELRKKGVSEDVINAALEEAPRDEKAELMKVLRKKRRKYDDQRLTAYLMRQGFSYEMVRQAIEESNRKELEDY